MTDDTTRLRHLEVALATLTADLRAHIAYCEGRMRVIWKLAAMMSGVIALAISVAVAFIRP